MSIYFYTLCKNRIVTFSLDILYFILNPSTFNVYKYPPNNASTVSSFRLVLNLVNIKRNMLNARSQSIVEIGKDCNFKNSNMCFAFYKLLKSIFLVVKKLIIFLKHKIIIIY